MKEFQGLMESGGIKEVASRLDHVSHDMMVVR
jgi:hypothetical protein